MGLSELVEDNRKEAFYIGKSIKASKSELEYANMLDCKSHDSGSSGPARSSLAVSGREQRNLA